MEDGSESVWRTKFVWWCYFSYKHVWTMNRKDGRFRNPLLVAISSLGCLQFVQFTLWLDLKAWKCPSYGLIRFASLDRYWIERIVPFNNLIAIQCCSKLSQALDSQGCIFLMISWISCSFSRARHGNSFEKVSQDPSIGACYKLFLLSCP
jgi:hypothetical protein